MFQNDISTFQPALFGTKRALCASGFRSANAVESHGSGSGERLAGALAGTPRPWTCFGGT